jgi:hypothetical protein
MMKHVRTILIFFTVFTVLSCGNGKNKALNEKEQQQYDSLTTLAVSNYQSKNYAPSFQFYKEAFVITDTAKSDLYGAACSAALAGNKAEAFKYLDLALENGWLNITHLKIDKDLNGLHNTEKWNAYLEKMTRKLEVIEADYNKPVQKELLQMYEDDQLTRREFVEAIDKYQNSKQAYKIDSLGMLIVSIDEKNMKKLAGILDKYGWLGPGQVGEMANTTIFLVIQHADHATQMKYLPKMREAVKKGNAKPAQLAMLEDRTALGQGKKQIYGSQLYTDDKNEQYLAPMIDPDHVDQRRKQAGLGPLSKYLLGFGLTWDVNQYKKDLPRLEKLAKEEQE